MAPVSTRRNATIIALVIGSALVHTPLRPSSTSSRLRQDRAPSITNAAAGALPGARGRRRHRRRHRPQQRAAATRRRRRAAAAAVNVATAAAAAAARRAAVAADAAAVPAAVAAEAGCPYRLRLPHWNVQQTKAADVGKLRAVLRYARAHRYDAVSLNELEHGGGARAIGAPHGYAHARRCRSARDAPRHPLVAPARRRAAAADGGHRPRSAVRAAGGGGGRTARRLDLCVTHLTSTARRGGSRGGALLHALPQSSAAPTVLLGDLNVLSPLDGFVALAGNGGGAGGGGVAAAAAAHAAAALPVLRGTKKLEKKFLDGRGGAAVG